MRIGVPPADRIFLIVGKLARIRRSSTMFCWSSIGTLKSTRTRTRLPSRSRSARPSLATMPLPSTHELFDDFRGTLGVRELVVVPGNHFRHALAEHAGRLRVEHRRVRVADDVAGHERLFRILEDA